MKRIPIGLYVIVFLLLSPLLVPIGLISYGVDVWRMRGMAAKFRCTRCGQVLGHHALHLADEAWGEYMAQLSRDNPGMRFRVVRTLDAICGNCGQQYTYQEKGKIFTVRAD